MGYFSNGTEGGAFREAYCERCVNWRDLGDDRGPGCPVMDAHFLFAYELCNKHDDPGKQILDMLIERKLVDASDGFQIGVNKCAMFVESMDAANERLAVEREFRLYVQRGRDPGPRTGGTDVSASAPHGDPPHGHCLLHGHFFGTWVCPSCQSQTPATVVEPPPNLFGAPLTEESARRIVREEIEAALARAQGDNE